MRETNNYKYFISYRTRYNNKCIKISKIIIKVELFRVNFDKIKKFHFNI